MPTPSDVNPDFNQQAQIRFLPGADGSCVPDEVMREIISRIEIVLPQQAGSVPCISTQQNNLVNLDAANCLFAAASTSYKDQETWSHAANVPVVFSGWPTGFDPTADTFYFVIPQFNAADFGKGKIEIGTVTSSEIPVSVVPIPSNTLANDVTLTLYMFQFPVPPQPTAS